MTEARAGLSHRVRWGMVGVALLVVAAALAFALARDPESSSAPPQLTISSAVVSEGSEVASGYLTIENAGGADELVAVEVGPQVATGARVHRSEERDGTVVMVPSDLTVAGQATTQLRPGADHLMLEGLQRPLAPGDEIELTLRFRRAGPVVVRASVQSYAEIARSLEEAAP